MRTVPGTIQTIEVKTRILHTSEIRNKYSFLILFFVDQPSGPLSSPIGSLAWHHFLCQKLLNSQGSLVDKWFTFVMSAEYKVRCIFSKAVRFLQYKSLVIWAEVWNSVSRKGTLSEKIWPINAQNLKITTQHTQDQIVILREVRNSMVVLEDMNVIDHNPFFHECLQF